MAPPTPTKRREGSEVEGWELCESESSLQQHNSGKENNTVEEKTAHQTVISELREEIASLKEKIGSMQTDLKTQLSKENLLSLCSDTNSLVTTLDQQITNRVNLSANKPTISKVKLGKPSEATVWAITNLGEIFINEKPNDASESAQMKDISHVQEVDLTGKNTPVIVPLDMGCNPGTEIIITGYIDGEAERMHINLSSQKDGVKNINFHFNPRFDNDPYEQGVVVRNTNIDGGWDEEEEREGDMPFCLGEVFTLRIVCCSDCYKVYIDEQLYCTYKHRLSPYDVTEVSIWRDVKPYKLIIKNAEPAVNPNDMLWQQLGGHLKSVESCHAGVTWGISHDHSLWVYNGGWGGSSFGSLDSNNVNPMIDYEDYYMYENQRWNAVAGYTSTGLMTDNTSWDNETDKEKSSGELVKLLSTDWQWATDWKVDFQVPGVDSEGWQYAVNSCNHPNNKTYKDYVRRRRWNRRCVIKTTGPWLELKGTKLLDVSLVPLSDKSDSAVIVWGVTSDGQVVVRNGVSQSNPTGMTWEIVSSHQALTSISCGPFDCVWGIGKNGNAYRRVGINCENPIGDSWSCVNSPNGQPLKQISVGLVGVWAIDRCGKLYVRKGITSDLLEGSGWQCILADRFIMGSASNVSFKQVSVGQTEVWVITSEGVAKKRLGITPDNPMGAGWNLGIPGIWQYLTVQAL